MDPQTPISNLPGIGSYYARKLKKLEIHTLEDLIYHFPFRYDDFSKIAAISDITLGEKLSVTGVLWQIKNVRTRSGKFVTVATLADQSGTIEVIWFNQPYLTKTLKAGFQISLSGKVQLDRHKPKLISPSYEVIRDSIAEFTHKRSEGPQNDKSNQPQTLHTGRLVSIYPETEGLSSKWLRSKIAGLLPAYLKNLKDFMPDSIIKNQKLLGLSSSLNKIHFPKTFEDVNEARKRLSFDEIFLTQIASLIRKLEWHKNRTSPKMKISKEKLNTFIKSLPYKLTAAQIKSIKEILTDMQSEKPTNRLLEGDVGSGKTVVAAAAALVANDNKFESLIAAPTEILAFQHQKTLTEILKPLGIKIGIWTGTKKQKGNITCGTHALLTTFKPTGQIGLVVVDEQHRFGVAQRAKLFLSQGAKLTPHLLTMTATPIPRTLALTMYGDLDLSVLDEMPKGRQKISTHVVPNFKRNDAYKFIKKEIEKGRQSFIITPFVEPSESIVTVKAATYEFEKLKRIFQTLDTTDTTSDVESKRRLGNTPRVKIKLGLLHGRLKSKEKESTVNKFKSGKIHILVATPVVEVGIDVPNATIMLIESADRFGLAQLHQLRGRVGRGKYKSYCFLFTDSRSENSMKRLKSMEKINVGFELAEIDLKMRGMGQIFGLKQSGFENFKIADFSDLKLISAAQSEAKNLLGIDQKLQNHHHLFRKIKSFSADLSEPN